MMRRTGFGLLLAGCIAGTASAAPFVVVDASPTITAMVDRGATTRGGGFATTDVLLISGSTDSQLVMMRFDCTARTWQQITVRMVLADYSLSPARASVTPARAVGTETLGASILEKACFDRLVKSGAGWSRPTLREAVEAGRRALARQAAGGT